jgi:hypothetical protein
MPLGLSMRLNTVFAFFLFFYWGTLWHLQQFLQCIKRIILEFTPPPFLYFLDYRSPYFHTFGIPSTDLYFFNIETQKGISKTNHFIIILIYRQIPD